MSSFWLGFLTGVWVGPTAVVLGLFFYAQFTRWQVPK